jgi:hypothetical protein
MLMRHFVESIDDLSREPRELHQQRGATIVGVGIPLISVFGCPLSKLLEDRLPRPLIDGRCVRHPPPPS